jgi:hypothetical protein
MESFATRDVASHSAFPGEGVPWASSSCRDARGRKPGMRRTHLQPGSDTVDVERSRPRTVDAVPFLSSQHVLALQRTAGNQAVGRVLQRMVTGDLDEGTAVWDNVRDRKCYIVRRSESRKNQYVVNPGSGGRRRNEDRDSYRHFDELDPIRAEPEKKAKNKRKERDEDKTEQPAEKKKKPSSFGEAHWINGRTEALYTPAENPPGPFESRCHLSFLPTTARANHVYHVKLEMKYKDPTEEAWMPPTTLSITYEYSVTGGFLKTNPPAKPTNMPPQAFAAGRAYADELVKRFRAEQ